MLDSILLKLNTGFNLLLKSPNWYQYYLDYLGIYKEPWVLRILNLKVLLRPKSIDKWIAAEEFALDIYKLNDISHLNFNQVFDIGAQIGTFSIHVSSVFPHAKIIAFEPDSKNYEMLLKNVTLNNLKDRVKPLNIAVSSEATEIINLYEGHDSAAKSTYKETDKFEAVKNLHFAKLKEMVNGTALLKVDVEGGEKDLFTAPFVDTLKVFKYIVVEYHHFLDTHQTEPFENFLTTNGFEFKKKDLVYFVKKKGS